MASVPIALVRDAINTALWARGHQLKVSNAQKKPSWAKMEMNGWWVG